MEKVKGKEAAVSLEERENVFMISLSGKTFSEYDDLTLFRSFIERLYKKKGHVLFDLSKVTYLNSRGLKEIISLHNHLVKTKHYSLICGVTASTKEVIMAINLPKKIPLFFSKEEAFQWIKAKK